ncbi:MAG: DUF2905 domain-containing protein [Rhodocyclaceae bacterium]|nr:DUF2905 domain-containing protein [Rhodocyclaceae bacterium]
MLKWLIVIVVIVVASALFDARPGRRPRLGALPGDLQWRMGGRVLRLPFMSTILLSLLAWGLFRLL